ncbi:hypothetical protein FKW77_000562 [Venturia effusa]|uniref:Piwi domain-containing protein n=1 Tax=Venturia effusa TaxID=50376 RepID=A0A517L6J2_9PEZI|nr:hypothetical protein FKW77_000562 [Venturia effusa]
MGGPERNKYQKREEVRKQAESEQQSDGHSSRDPATLQIMKSVRASQTQAPSQFSAGVDYISRGSLQHLGSTQSGYGFKGYGPGGPRSESGSSMSSGSSVFGAGGSIGGQFDGPKDARPSQVNIGNLELGARIWFNTRGGQAPDAMPVRPPKLNNLGKECNIGLNTYHVTQFPTKVVFQYDKHMPAKDGNPAPEFKIHRFVNKDPYSVTFDVDKEAGIKSTVAAYFKKQYNITCMKDVPCIELTKKGEHVPIECLQIPENQRYRLKLDEKQTSNMIKFAVTLPAERWKHIQEGVNMLNWQADPFLNNYGLKVSPTRAEVKGRVLPTPEPTFATGKIDARTASSGRWRIDGKKFLSPNTQELKAWGVGIINYGRGPCVSQQATLQFFTQFKKIYGIHGGKIATIPVFLTLQLARGGEMITDLWNAVGNKFQMKPQLLFFLVENKNSEIYNRIKKSCECRYGVVSQVLQSQHVAKCQDQYISNVCMKVNAKLGGSTCRAASTVLAKLDPTFSKIPTLIIGADVSHGAPGSEEGSMAAITASMTTDFTRYAALCETNGNRVEIISTSIIMKQLKQLVELWMSQPAMRGAMPQRVLYYRDGVSSGQYQHVLEQEVADMRKLFKTINPQVQPKITVIICAKRHHIRFFPAAGHGDRNGNPNPGTLIETGCTNPFEFDFYLNSHSAIKGTARPVHYHVILDECKLGPMVLQQVTFEHCFQYMRSTTPVSMFPAVYYAHLASNRAKAHANKPTVSSGKKETHKGQGRKDEQTLSSSERGSLMEIPPLMPLNNGQGIVSSMWYI